MARKRMFDDKATWRTVDQWGNDQTQPARAERVFDPNDAVTNDSSPSGGFGGAPDTHKITQMTGTMYTGLNDDPSQMVSKSYK